MLKVIESLLTSHAHHARQYVNRTHVIRATRIWFKGKPGKKTEIRLTCGRPNHYERRFLKSYSGPFPSKIQVDSNG